MNLTAGLTSNLSSYSQTDYRRYLSAHLQFLNGLCELSNKTVENSIDQFLSSLFITSQLLSKTNFHDRLDSLIEQIKSNTPTTFRRLLFLIRNVNHGNSIISAYGTNFQYIAPWYKVDWFSYAPTEAMIYDNECSCGSSPNCTSQASFIKRNSSKIVLVKGMKIGCTPSESFLASTLECFYDQSCINLIQKYTNNINMTSPISLSSTKSRFSMNTTMTEYINHSFIEQWLITKNYSSYFKQCSLLFCSYTYIQRFNLLYIVTVLLGLQGGLMIVLKLICPRIVRIIDKVYQYRKKRMNVVQPVSSFPITPVNQIICNSNFDLQPIPINTISPYIVFIFILFIIYHFSSLEQILPHHVDVLTRLS